MGIETEERKIQRDFRVGDWVRVLGNGGVFRMWDAFFAEKDTEYYDNDLEYYKQYFVSGELPTVGEICEILYVGPHYCDTPTYLLGRREIPQTYLMHNDYKELVRVNHDVGEKVQIDPNLKESHELDVVEDMLEYAGRVAKVMDVLYEGRTFFYYLDIGDSWWRWHHDTLRIPSNCCPENMTIEEDDATYIFNGPATICIVRYGDFAFKGVAKCNPADVWDEDTGRAWAYMRAMKKFVFALEKELKES